MVPNCFPTPTHLPIVSYILPSPVSRLPSPVSRLPSPVSRLPSPVSRLPSPVSRLPSPVSRLPSPVSRLPSPVSRLPSPVSRLPSPNFPVLTFSSKTLKSRCPPAQTPCITNIVLSFQWVTLFASGN
ncbi:uncharacterized protein F5147DRAFT_780003 [Suillus discolor]|uniref:Uncharacterized protein n=1 Tax=Suillus discolor TaxID=1912936 RepID=A0A9P7EUD3_9AGAM|nr:uncharacterized protein F5147DRAFT_780003 [Suillus discolor]KAG2091318.1 hypothetical protein F5147DRAFT_780003 [Suillus discolor]